VQLLKWILCCANLVEWAACIPIHGWVPLGAGTGTCKWCSCLFAGEGANCIRRFFAFLDGKNTSNGVCMYVWIAMDRESLHIYRANDSGVETDSKGPEFEWLVTHRSSLGPRSYSRQASPVPRSMPSWGTWSRQRFYFSLVMSPRILEYQARQREDQRNRSQSNRGEKWDKSQSITNPSKLRGVLYELCVFQAETYIREAVEMYEALRPKQSILDYISSVFLRLYIRLEFLHCKEPFTFFHFTRAHAPAHTHRIICIYNVI